METSTMNNRFFRPLLLCLPLVLLASACDGDGAPEDSVDIPAPLDETEEVLDPEGFAAAPCLTDEEHSGPLPEPPRGMLEPGYRIDEFEGMSPEELVPPAPTEAELQAALSYSDRFALADGTLRTHAPDD